MQLERLEWTCGLHRIIVSMLMSLFFYFYWDNIKESLGKIDTEIFRSD